MSQVDLDAVKNEAKRRIHNLVEDYMRVLASGKKESFNEERVKIAFMVPFLEALRWNPRTDEVLPEQATLTGRADFGLRVGGRTKIFLEMKSFKKSLDGYDTVKGRHRSYAEQAIQYAWGMKADWAILTNFEEIRLYDSHVKKPEDGLVWKKSIRFTEYESRFDELWLISKESVVSGALDAYKAKVERPPVDEAFLSDLMNCRRLLAENIKINNPGLTSDKISESVQKILDRLIFIKNCEDRLIIPAESLWKRFKAWQETAIDRDIVIFMMDLKNLFRYFDRVYNGKLFEKHPCEDLRISNETLEEIIDTLYGDGRHLGYNFSVIPVDVLGQAYELYIGSIIKEKEREAKTIEIISEPSKRKAHGIYYTPEYVVDYIVGNTLGKLLDNCKTPKDVSIAKVLDPACGSGSFLIKAFDEIKEWYKNYNKSSRPAATPDTLDAHLVLVPDVEDRILTENLYGVDVDPQAVEIAILNLSLKAVKTKEKLPYMGDHIRCGNSLVFGRDEELETFFVDPREKRSFDWREEFPHILEQGGFDVIIGNPPYVQMQKMPEEERRYFKNFYPKIYDSQNDLWYYFLMKSLQLLKKEGWLGFITSRYWMEAGHAKKIREYILENSYIQTIVDFGSVPIFKGVGTHTNIIILRKRDSSEPPKRHLIRVIRIKEWYSSNESLLDHIKSHFHDKAYMDKYIEIFDVEQSGLTKGIWVLVPEKVRVIVNKLEQNSWKLMDICQIGTGVKSGYDSAFVVDEDTKQNFNLEPSLLKKWIKNSEIERYYINYSNKYILYLTKGVEIDDYPNTKRYLLEFRRVLEKKWKSRNEDANWYELYRPREYLFVGPQEKIICPYKATHNIFAFDSQEYCGSGDIYAIAPRKNISVSLKYILALLNSKALCYYFRQTGKRKGDIYEYYTEPLSQIPIHRIDFSNPKETSLYEDLVALVNEMLSSKERSSQVDTGFVRYINSNPRIENTTFGAYYSELEIADKETLKDSNNVSYSISPPRNIRREIKKTNIHKDREWLIFDASYIDIDRKEKKAKQFRDIPVLRCRFRDLFLREYLYYWIKNLESNPGKGNILGHIQKIAIPRFHDNPDVNKQIIDKIMKEYLELVEKKKELERKIQEIDDSIDKKVYELYGLSQEEISLVESSV